MSTSIVLSVSLAIASASALPNSAEDSDRYLSRAARQTRALWAIPIPKPKPERNASDITGARAAYEKARDLGNGWKVSLKTNGLKLNKKF